MKTISRLPPRYIAKDDTWLCEEDWCEYVPDFEAKEWVMVDGVRKRPFPAKHVILKSLDSVVHDDS
jgi:hypothetical protein